MHFPAGWLDRLRTLRSRFLDDDRAGVAMPDYWRDELDLTAYDALPAARIGWKWNAALREARDRGLTIDPNATVLDFGCGTGIAARRFLTRFPVREVLCHDRSARARAFAVARLANEQPKVKARPLVQLDLTTFDVLLVSHVLGELDDDGRDALLALAQRASVVVWVEPGSKAVSRHLGDMRSALLGAMHVVAPCPHAAICPALASASDWCHFFAEPPPEVFTDGDWVKAARELGIDLRSLPYSFLVMTKALATTPPPPHRLLGRAAIGRHEATLQACTAEGLHQLEVRKRDQAALWRQLKKDPGGHRTLPAAP